MTLGPDEIRAALAREQDELARRTDLGNQLTGVALAGLGWLPLYAGACVRLHDAQGGAWFWIGLLLTVVLISSSAIVTRRDRKHDSTFAPFWIATLAVSAVIAIGTLVAVWTQDSSVGLAWKLAALFLIAPLVACAGLAVTARARR